MNSFYILLVIIPFAVAALAAGHALLNKREPRAALGWVAVCITFPLAGPLLYYLFGINRVRRSAAKMREDIRRKKREADGTQHGGEDEHTPPGSITDFHIPRRYLEFERVGRNLTGRPLAGGNTVETLHNGEAAYPAMLDTIASARERVYLATYIMESGPVGRRFAEALADAIKRGVDVRVIVDGIGEKYSWPRISKVLREHGVPVKVFLPPKLFPPQFSINLRNHRKILVADGQVAFTGGMNIGRRHMAWSGNPRKVTDVHFRFSGPIAAQLQETFLEDWGFITGDFEVPPPVVYDPPEQTGNSLCRAIPAGPDEPYDRLAALLNGMVSSARRSLRIMTPYFLPPRDVLASIKAAALRGVDVRIILPAKNNLPFVHWASQNQLWELLQYNVRIFYQPAPFCHSKLFIADGTYVNIGSANVDPRSLRLNFELTVEVFDVSVARQLARHFDQVQQQSEEVFLEDVDGRSLPVRFRDAVFWLFSPYL